MNVTEFKRRVKELGLIQESNKVEQRRLRNATNRLLNDAIHRFRKLETDKEIKVAWHQYNKYHADWIKSHNKLHHEAMKSKYTDYSYLAYNGVADDF